MAKNDMNNEIILLRHTVRQARICIINKLIKEAKLLRNKHGDKTQLEKYKRKADRLLAEVHALKTIQNDDITKFGILNEKDLTEILQDPSSDNRGRIIARVVHYKTLYRRLMQLKEKFPDYKKYLTEGKKKGKKLKNKGASKVEKSSTENNSRLRDKSLRKRKVNPDEEIENSQDNSKSEEERDSESLEERNNSRKRKKSLDEDEPPPLERQKSLKLEESGTLKDTDVNRQSDASRNVTREGVVKRFTEFLEEPNKDDVQMSVESPSSTCPTVEGAKTTDDFFFTGNGRNYYENSISAATSQEGYTRTKAFQTGDRMRKQNTKNKSDTKFQRKNLGELSLATKSKKMTSNDTNRGTNKSNLNEANVKEENDVHPSWLAKRKEKEMMSKGFQGKKIVFTDD